MNKSILLGRLTKEPEIRYTQESNNAIAIFTLAVNRRYVKEGEERQADFFKVIAYSKLAEFVQRYIKKGNQICVSGRLQNRSWEDENGVKRYATEIIAEEISFADSAKKVENNSDPSGVFGNTSIAIPTESEAESSLESDDLPF